ncbi:AraC family transcriptional regulator [Bacillus safensis]|uniref:AraC family transcriptional regulator n=1 Tax=Bacillus safensis TaxID=561879 RepID=A0A1L6ZI95_BACIA|nr:AraC family transcriptional regulator [Bacillus safensis]APT46192.1 AraC family transcriptional regulator [Bacillus safensis]MCW4643615.1 AraC family transcriptional regulator [Bacillus safensis]MCY7564530.1 AraC family transcriptional regulator [Bacillus safensis]MCY7624805.1 AraC family transcriptional regulator [Bacillus safensis]MCY7634852.1 AraC family transcriptional regulator [Bacillus safensis]
MNTQEERTVHFDQDLQIEAYRFHGIMQKFPNHFHTYYVIGFIEDGQRRLICQNQEYIIEKGDILLFNPYDNHACEQIDHRTLDYRCLNIEADVLEKVFQHKPHFKAPVFSQSELTNPLYDLHQMITEEAPALNKQETFYFFMKQLIEAYADTPGGKVSAAHANEQKVQDVQQYIETHLTENISLDDLGELVSMNKYSLLRAFTKFRGITPYRYLQTVRVNYAKELLAQGVKPVDAAASAGFSDQSHLSHFFSEFIGLTPGQYQQIFVKQVTADEK